MSNTDLTGNRIEYSREELVALCERAVVPVEKWRNRDSASAQEGIGRAWVMLRAGCEFDVRYGPPTIERSGCFTDESTIWIDIEWPGFQAFEYERANTRLWDSDIFYLPTAARLERANGDDWY